MPGLRAGFEPVESASAKFDLCLSLAEQLAADGSPAGLAGVLEYASDLFDRGRRAGAGGAAHPAAGGGGWRCRCADRAAGHPGAG